MKTVAYQSDWLQRDDDAWGSVLRNLLTALIAVVFALTIGSGTASAQPAFMISGGSPYTLPATTGPTPIDVGTTGYVNALLNVAKSRVYKFEFLGCGNSIFDNRFFLGTDTIFFNGPRPPSYKVSAQRSFACNTNAIGDTLRGFLKVANFGPHSPFHFQADASLPGPSVFNGEGPLNGTYTESLTPNFSNTSIFYAIDGSGITSPAGLTSGDVVLLGLADGGVPDDNDYQDLVVRITAK